MRTTSSKSALHHKFHPGTGIGKVASVSLDEQLLQAVVSTQHEIALRQKMIKLAFTLQGTAGVCFLRKDIEDEWTLARDAPSSGRLPDWREFSESLSEKCETLALSSNVQTEALPDGKLFGVLAPIHSRSGQSEIMLVAMASQKAAVLATSDMQKITAALGLWINNNLSLIHI